MEHEMTLLKDNSGLCKEDICINEAIIVDTMAEISSVKDEGNNKDMSGIINKDSTLNQMENDGSALIDENIVIDSTNVINSTNNTTDISNTVCTSEVMEVDVENDKTISPGLEKTEREASCYSYNWSVTPILLCIATKEYQPTITCENFTKGCQWSPDGTCLLVPSEDFRIRIYELPATLYPGRIPADFKTVDLTAALTIKEGGLIYDSCWYPFMNSWDAATCCFLSTSKESPVHLWDAFTGELRATYRAYNDVDEVEASMSVQFIQRGREVWCGFKNALRIFDTDRPGRQRTTINFKNDFPNISGLVSCIRENPIMPGLVAFGTYSKCIGLYKDTPICTFKTASGVTHVEFSPCGTKLYSAVRRNNELLCWDLRNPGVVLYSFKGRESDTNQRIQFDVTNSGTEIVSGGTDGSIAIWKLLETLEYEEELNPIRKIKLSEDSLNGVSLHRSLPILATSSGQRLSDLDALCRDNSVRIWWIS